MTVTSSNWRPTVYSSKTFVVSRSLTDWSNTRIAPSVSSILRRYVQACLRFLTKSDRPNAVGNATSTTINPTDAGLAVSVLFVEIWGDENVEHGYLEMLMAEDSIDPILRMLATIAEAEGRTADAIELTTRFKAHSTLTGF